MAIFQFKKVMGHEYPLVSDFSGTIIVSALTVLLGLSTNIGFISILGVYLLCLPLFLWKNTFVLKPTIGLAIIVLLPVLGIISSSWSHASFKSLYSGVQFLSMVLCCISIARVVSAQSFLIGLTLGFLSVLIYVFSTLEPSSVIAAAAGGEGFADFSGFGSKNKIGFYALVGFCASFALYFEPKKGFLFKIFIVLIPCAFFIFFLINTNSMTSLVTLFGLIAFVKLFVLFVRLSLPTRVFIVFAVAMLALLSVLFFKAFNINPVVEILLFLGKSPTLTGRTYLWELGLDISQNNPLLGYGYSAFWLEGNALAENIWREFFIGSKTGFHFHNTYVTILVDLGLLGLSVLVFLYATSLYCSFKVFNKSTRNALTVFCAGIFVVFFIRSFAEADILGPYGIGTFLFFSSFGKLEFLVLDYKAQNNYKQ